MVWGAGGGGGGGLGGDGASPGGDDSDGVNHSFLFLSAFLVVVEELLSRVLVPTDVDVDVGVGVGVDVGLEVEGVPAPAISAPFVPPCRGALNASTSAAGRTS